ncbi:MAG: hypothetical protein HDQ98_09015 [Lachnospiraceae bacterium]|nr:hypothetical protein [Lachnospiraceae bacterium]
MEYLYNFGFMLKTYRKDLSSAKRLVSSFIQYNDEKLPLFIVVSQMDFALFQKQMPNKRYIHLMKEEDIPVQYVTENTPHLHTVGYINQQIVKLAFWETGLCKNYCCIDSDAVFISKIRQKRFLYDNSTPYSTLIEDNDLRTENRYYRKYWQRREVFIRKIWNTIGLKQEHILTCHGFQTMSALVLDDFKRNFLLPQSKTYSDILCISPYEFSWYNAWLQKSGTIPIYPCESPFKTYHMRYQWIRDRLSGINIDSLKRSYVGIILNSNWHGHKNVFPGGKPWSLYL